ncbi:trypsin-1 [Megachile rotundata]|uniref:trypsin-1 n=1 Tax=Megachile rotundata TaxID=143995 RepID=UPI003FD65561
MSDCKKIILLTLLYVFSNVAALENTEYVNIRDYPYHVSIEKHGNHACSGALVHESWIVTVASCVFRVEPSTVTVRVRASNLYNDGDTLKVTNIVVHENFDKYVLFNNIALIKLKIPVQFGEKLLPIGVAENEDYEPDDGTMCFVTGWRQTVPNATESRLSVTTVPLMNRSICSSKMPPYQPVLQMMLCAGNATSGVETCQGDPGAPLMEGQTLIGVLSYGLGCKTMIHPGVYTRISSYLAWISSNTGILYTKHHIGEN